MKIKVIASGSKGNCTLIICENTKFLIDIGIPLSHVTASLEASGTNIKELSGILITHTHSDHIKGLLQLVKKYKIKVFSGTRTFKDIAKIVPLDSIVIAEDTFNINDVKVSLLETSHDVESYGFVIEYKNR